MNRIVTLSRVVRTLAGAALLAAAIGGGSACLVPAGVYVDIAPPPPMVEARMVPPGPGFVWVPGFYSWNGGAYIWVSGRWERPPRPRAVWVPGHWDQHGRRGWRYVEGRWR